MRALSLAKQKELAKTGMIITMGATLVTACFMKGKAAKRLHVVAGIGLVGFSIWHHRLYQAPKIVAAKEKQNVPAASKVSYCDAQG